MKKLFAAVLAATVLAAPLAQAQMHRPEPQRNEWRDDRRAPPVRKPVVKRWQRGEQLRPGVSQQRLGVRDLRRLRLPEPRRGQAWVKVGDQFLLIAPNGLILSVFGR